MPAPLQTRADTLTSTLKKREYWADFLDSFVTTPVGGELARVTNENSVVQALKNLFHTNVNERLFNPLVGTGIFNDLFEIDDSVTLQQIELNVQTTIDNFEPRANLLEVTAFDTTEHAIQVDIVIALINNPDPISISFILKRVR